MQDPHYYTGSDDREFGPDPDACEVCGVAGDEPCKPLCDCEDCIDREPPEPDGEAFRGGEAAGYLAEQQAAAQRLKR